MWTFEERLFSLLGKGLGVGWWGPNTKCCSGIGYCILPTHLLWIRAPPCPVCRASVIPAVAGFSNLRHAGGVQCEHMYFIRHFLVMKGITHVYTQLLTIRLGALSSCLLSEFQIFFLFKKLFPPALLVSFYAFIILSMIYPCIYYISIYLFTIFYQLSISPLCNVILLAVPLPICIYCLIIYSSAYLRSPIYHVSMYQPSTNVLISYLPVICPSVRLSIHLIKSWLS